MNKQQKLPIHIYSTNQKKMQRNKKKNEQKTKQEKYR